MIDIKITKDTKIWDQAKKNLKLDSLELSIGFFPESRYGTENNNLPVAQVAQWNEEGSLTNPPRSFMRVGFGIPLMKGKYDKQFKASIQRITEGKSTFNQEYSFLGKVFVKEMRQSIIDWDTPPNSPRTVSEKGFNDPLRDSDTMLNSVDYKIEKKGSD